MAGFAGLWAGSEVISENGTCEFLSFEFAVQMGSFGGISYFGCGELVVILAATPLFLLFASGMTDLSFALVGGHGIRGGVVGILAATPAT